MKTLMRPVTLLAILMIALVAGCTSTPEVADVKVSAMFEAPIDTVRQAAVDALVVTGFDVKKQDPDYVEGYRPRKVGFFVGSGGETVGVWLTELAPGQVEVKVRTARTFVGGAGQRNWDDEVMAEMRKSLGQ